MFLDKLNWRYAAKKMDPTKPVAEETVEKIVEAVRLAPTSSGLQPFELLVIRNMDLRATLRPSAWDQAQLTDGSHLLVFAAWDNYSDARIDEVVAQQIEARPPLKEKVEAYYGMLKQTYLPRDAQVNFEHAARQAYFALGFAMAAAAELEVDCTPMEGFDPEKFDEILGLKEKGLRSVVILPLGHREAGTDWLQPLPKLRKSRARLVTDLD